MTATAFVDRRINGLDARTLNRLSDEAARNPRKVRARFKASTNWIEGAKAETSFDFWEFGGIKLRRNYTIRSDEPRELAGQSTAVNGQELLLAAINSCLVARYAAQCTLREIELENLHVESEGEFDIRGLFGLTWRGQARIHDLDCIVRIRGNASPEQFVEIHEEVLASSPTLRIFADTIRLHPTLKIEYTFPCQAVDRSTPAVPLKSAST